MSIGECLVGECLIGVYGYTHQDPHQGQNIENIHKRADQRDKLQRGQRELAEGERQGGQGARDPFYSKMVLAGLGRRLTNALQSLNHTTVIDEDALKSMLKEICAGMITQILY